MPLKKNLHYWRISLENPEPLLDPHYFHNPEGLVFDDREIMTRIHKIRDLVITYSVHRSRKSRVPKWVLQELRKQVFGKGGNLSEFSAFFKVLDFSMTAAKDLSDEELLEFIEQALNYYIEFREKAYRERRLEYSDITAQTLRDSGATRATGGLANDKIIKMLRNAGINEIIKEPPVDEVRKRTGAKYRFADTHQGKKPDVLFRYGADWFVVEAKHLKESGGAQDKSASELVAMIDQEDRGVYYVSFMDGIFFNRLISPGSGRTKYARIRSDVERILSARPRSFFVNTRGFEELISDAVK